MCTVHPGFNRLWMTAVGVVSWPLDEADDVDGVRAAVVFTTPASGCASGPEAPVGSGSLLADAWAASSADGPYHGFRNMAECRSIPRLLRRQ